MSSTKQARMRRADILFVADSRGRGGEQLFSNDPLINVTKLVRPGATLDRLLDETISIKNSTNYDLVVVAGGICNFTQRETIQGVKTLSYRHTTEGRRYIIESLKNKIKDARLKLGRKLILGTIVPACLSNYLTHHNIAKNIEKQPTREESVNEEQRHLIEDIEEINAAIREDNRVHDRRSLNWAQFVLQRSKKRKRKGAKTFADPQRRFNLNGLQDGVHFNQELQDKCFKALEAVVNSELAGVSEESNSSSQDETEVCFKRRKLKVKSTVHVPECEPTTSKREHK